MTWCELSLGLSYSQPWSIVARRLGVISLQGNDKGRKMRLVDVHCKARNVSEEFVVCVGVTPM